MRRTRKRTGKIGYMISAVAEMYNIHPQTLRLYEREGLLIPSRSQGNTRLYTKDDLERLEVILKLTRDLGVNLAGVEIILNMRQRMSDIEKEVQAFIEFVRGQVIAQQGGVVSGIENAMVRVAPPRLIRTTRGQNQRARQDESGSTNARLLTATRKS